MPEILDESEIDNFLKKSLKRFWITPEMGRVRIEITSPIYKIESGEEDLAGMTWSRPTTLFQIKAKLLSIENQTNGITEGGEYIISIGTDRATAFLEGMKTELMKKGKSFKEIVGTIWEVKALDRFDWQVAMLDSPQQKTVDEKGNITLEKAMQDLRELKNLLKMDAIAKETAISRLAISNRITVQEAEELINKLKSVGLVREENEKIVIP